MAKIVTIVLSEPIVGHRGVITEIVLKPPNLAQYMAIGEPVSVVPGPQGEGVVVDNDAAIAAYAEACMVEPKDKLLLDQVQLADAMEVKEAIIGFFLAARRARTSNPPAPEKTPAQVI